MAAPTAPAPPTPSTAKTTGSTSTAAPRLKLVIRRLPPTLPEEIFWRSVGPWLGDVNDLAKGASKISWKRYVAGKPVSDTNQHRVFSRAYVQMKTAEDLAEFAHAYDGHGFRGKDGQEFQAVVEFAPAQKVPSTKSKPRVDARQGTIDNDADFLSFLESLKAPIVKQDINAVEAQAEQPKSTPLLDHLRETRLGKKSSSSGARSSTPDQGKGGRGRDVNNATKDKGKGSGKNNNNNKPGEKDSGGKNVKGDKKDAGKLGANGKKEQVQTLPANRENVKIQLNPARQPGGAGGNTKVQILQRGPGDNPPAGPSNTNAPPKPNKQAPPVPKSKDGDAPTNKPKPKPTARQRPERGPKSLLSAALNASAQQAGGKKPAVVASNPGGGAGDTSEPASADDADKKKRSRTRGGRGGTGKKQTGEGGAGVTGVTINAAATGGSGANPARIDD